MAEIVNGRTAGVVRQADDRVGLRWPTEIMARDEEAGDRAADETRDHQPERRRRNADFERVGDAEALSVRFESR